jgi:hypothetical protein
MKRPLRVNPIRGCVYTIVAGVILAAVGSPVNAGEFLPCEQPSVFRNAAVNTTILQYTSDRAPLSEAARQLSQMIQLDMLFSLVKYESVGVEHLNLNGPRSRECSEQVVVEKLLGARYGARERVQPGMGLVVVSGSIYEEGSDMFIRSQLHFLRAGIPEQVTIRTKSQTAESFEFLGSLPYQAVVFSPRRITREDLERIKSEYQVSLRIRPTPDAHEAGSAMPLNAGTFAYQVEEVQGDWMRIRSPAGPSGWVRARVDPSGWPYATKCLNSASSMAWSVTFNTE